MKETLVTFDDEGNAEEECLQLKKERKKKSEPHHVDLAKAQGVPPQVQISMLLRYL